MFICHNAAALNPKLWPAPGAQFLCIAAKSRAVIERRGCTCVQIASRECRPCQDRKSRPAPHCGTGPRYDDRGTSTACRTTKSDRGQIPRNSRMDRSLKNQRRPRTARRALWVGGHTKWRGHFGDPIPVITVQLGGSLAGKLSSRLSSILSSDEIMLLVSASRQRLRLAIADTRRCDVTGLGIM
jgi:hypothetical protein